jgi:imidazolonepropionase-like amidohydrolase
MEEEPMAARHTVLKGGRLIDGTGGDPIDDAVLVIEDGRIESVRQTGTVGYPEDTHVVDVAGKTIMPGLIDAHVHLAGLKSMAQVETVLDNPMLQGMRGVLDVWKVIDAGFTTVRDACCVHALHLKEAVNEGSIVGPRILAAGRAITQTGGHSDHHFLPLEWAASSFNVEGRVADGVAEVRKAAREQLRAGADHLKIHTTGGVMSEKGLPTSCQYSLEEIRAFVEEARNWGVRTAAHAQGTQGIKNALICGINSIEHGVMLDDECIDLMLKDGACLVPTLAIVEAIIHKGPKVGVLEASLRKARSLQKEHLVSFKKAYRAGVTCGLGTDYLSDPMSPMGANAVELELYVERAGLTPMETLVCATRNNAEVLGLGDKLGTLEAGKWADILVVQGDPSQDISILRNKKNILSIYKGGTMVPRLGPIGVRGIEAA